MYQNLEDLIKRTAEHYGISEDEARESINKAITTWREIKEAFIELFNFLAEKVQELVDLCEDIVERQEHKWNINWDTRKKSQVMNRRPKLVYIRRHL